MGWSALVLVPLAALASLLLLPMVSELLSLLRFPVWRRPFVGAVSDPPPKLLFLVLAHDEELLLAGTIRSLQAQDYPPERREIVVVADNCTDATAAVARAEGVTVWERTDAVARGKPPAIAWAMGQLDLAALDGVVIIDADTQVIRSFSRVLATRAPFRQKVLQPFIAVQNPDESALTRMASVHGTVSHGLAYRIKERAGLNVPLGVGMCLGTDVLRAEPWSAFSIAEDWELYCQYTARGVRIEPVPGARISAQEAKSLAQSAPQRHRWLAGKVGVLLKYIGPVFTSPRTSIAQRIDALAELTIPGPAVHLGAAVALGALAWLIGGTFGYVVAAMFAVSLLRPVVYTIVAILVDPAPVKAFTAFLYLPVYTAWRLGPAVKSVFSAKASRWVRTDRHAADGDKA